jgi:hypothetical protein
VDAANSSWRRSLVLRWLLHDAPFIAMLSLALRASSSGCR